VWVGLAQDPLEPHPLLGRHKVSWRPHYDPGLRQAEARGWFDLIFSDAQGRLVEGARSSLFVRLAGRWATPAVARGALPGVWRAKVLADPAWGAEEGPLTVQDLARAEALMVCNALRGPLVARLAPAL